MSDFGSVAETAWDWTGGLMVDGAKEVGGLLADGVTGIGEAAAWAADSWNGLPQEAGPISVPYTMPAAAAYGDEPAQATAPAIPDAELTDDGRMARALEREGIDARDLSLKQQGDLDLHPTDAGGMISYEDAVLLNQSGYLSAGEKRRLGL